MIVRKFLLMSLISFFVLSISFNKSLSAEPAKSASVTYTAPITLYWLAKAGVPEAVEYVKYIDAERIIKPEHIKQYERVEKINKIYQEIRYASLNDFFESEKYNNILDLGCGVSPRCLYTSKKKINYVGTDLKDVVDMLNVYAPNFINDDAKSYVKFAIADASNRKEMINSAKSLKGKICIVEEGLLMYLTRDQQRVMLESIRDILKKNGGCFVTSDFVAGEMFMLVNETVYGKEDALIVGKETQKLYESVSEILFNDTMFKSEDEAIKFIDSCGLKVEKRPIFSGKPDIRSIRDLNSREINKINEMLKEKFLWVLTVK